MIKELIYAQGKKAKEAARVLATAPEGKKNEALLAMAKALREKERLIVDANQQDLAEGEKKGLSKALLDRLLLNSKRIAEMAQGLEAIAALPDPVGEVVSMWTRPNGLQIGKMRVPLGVIGIIYESRPNVTVDAAGLCLKTGNAVILRGGSEAFRSNKAIASILREAVAAVGLPENAVQLVETTDREAVDVMLKMNQYLDVLIPRGGAGLIQNVVQNATVPVIETGVGNCHVYVDQGADLEMAKEIVINAKTQRPGVCNAMETLLVHAEEADKFLPALAKELLERGVELRGCPRTKALIAEALEATEDDWYTEFLDLILAIRIVDSMEEAIEHIAKYGTKHSEAIITKDYARARQFVQQVDAAAVYVNASTRFTDGYQFGFGAEIGISTQKLHARGPMGPVELTTFKYIIYGDGQIRT
ncbi:glutamate-5-semialdehyde dehydrogenase [Zhaonella formicivorans]|uniref:glutamate-5-semialdehyde dehydrogenase n=1 Tax=Zhaonella formicivorans TaxID=2528593 RepID=UPI0010E7E8F6|nr:glutamate-5-semialdehyde dehydrogenase [Zhaonella formicivorans]